MKLPKWLRLLSLVIIGLMIIAVGVMTAVELKGRRQDKIASVTAENATALYRTQFQIGEPLAVAEHSLASLHLNTLDRGNDNILIIAKEGRSIWYCNHNYFGTALRFSGGKLFRIESDEWLETCL